MKKILSSLWQDWAILLVGVIWGLSYFFARGVLESSQLADWLRVSVALLPILPFGYFLYLIALGIRTMDELHIRVQLEALALAFPLAILLLMTLGLVGQALDLSYERHVWHYLPVCYFLGLAIAWRRYR
jgi:hypothetical protein